MQVLLDDSHNIMKPVIKVDGLIVLEEQADLYKSVLYNGTELYTSQDGCYAEYEYNNCIYILNTDGIQASIKLKEED